MTKHGVTCAPSATSIEHQLYHFGYNTDPTFPKCKNPRIRELNNERELVKASCLDMLQRGMSAILVSLSCDEEIGTIYTHSVIPRYNVIRLRTCCSEDEIFDFTTRTCVPGGNANSASLTAVVEKQVDFVGVYRGGPYCTNPMIDYEINREDLRFENHSLLVNKNFYKFPRTKIVL